MSCFQASTQYNDEYGTVSVTWHAENRLDSFAKHCGVPDDQIPIGLRINRAFGLNRMDFQDKREKALAHVEIFTVASTDLAGQTIPEYFQSSGPGSASYRKYLKDITDIESLLDWFKELDLVISLPQLTKMKLPDHPVEECQLD